MHIRAATPQDAHAIAALLGQLSYPQRLEDLRKRLHDLCADDRCVVWVAVNRQEKVCGFIALNLIYDLADHAALAQISYLCVDQLQRRQHIGDQLLSYAEQFARERGCRRVELHCDQRRQDAHQFYLQQGYAESPKFFRKYVKT